MKIYVERIVTKSFRLFGVLISSDINNTIKFIINWFYKIEVFI